MTPGSRDPGGDLEREGDREWDLEWDEVVDVICVGSGPGVLAYAIACATAEFDVALAHRPPGYDADALSYLAAMTDDLDGCPPREALEVSRAEPTVIRPDRRATVETFAGEQLRQWSARCLASPVGVMFTEVPPMLTPMRAETGELITAAVLGANPSAGAPLMRWLGERADEFGIEAPCEVLDGLIYREGRLAGAALRGESGRRLVRASAGLAFSVGPAVVAPPALPALPDASVALVGRRAGRFAKIELLAPGRP